MITITKDNIIAYMKKHMPDLDTSVPMTISMVGEGSAEEDGDGYVNYIFRVQSEKGSYVVKQGLPMGRMTGAPMNMERNKLDYDAMRIFYAIAPEYVPFLVFHDEDNNVFVMEDVSYLNVARFQFNKNVIFPIFGRQCGEYLAKTSFYTSEYYLSREEYADLQNRFANVQMRKVMEDGMFLDRFGMGSDTSLGKEFEDFCQKISTDRDYVTELYKIRRSYMSHADALIHADFHTSNIFASEDQMKVIDMEFAFMGPFGYDLGYLAGNLISQYCAACYKPFDSEMERMVMKSYYLSTIKALYETYFKVFDECWHKDVKERYVGQEGLLQSIQQETLLESIGYASMVNWFRAAAMITYPDFEVIEDENKKRNAKSLSLVIDWQIMFARYSYRSVDDLIDTILFVEDEYRKLR
ncbi:MAG: phosphotransferase [Eubacteriales bacterium]|nr:phosphotransferase [Lachnospiraceae bacterium]MDO4977601.1 phosphotransferase [Eubacteriales bacterium]